MAVRTSEELIQFFHNDELAARFGRAFLSTYLVPALGVLSKSEIDLRVFSLLVEVGAIDPDGPIFSIARALNITPARARSLIFQYQLRHVSEADTERAVLTTIARARYWKDGASLAFGVESPLVRAAIAAKMRERGVFSDVSLSGDILKVSPEQFGEVIGSLLPSDTAAALAKKLRKQGVNESKVRKAVERYSATVAEDFIKDQAKGGLKDLLGGLARGVTDNAPEAVDFLARSINAFL